MNLLRISALALLATACASSIRSFTYPPSFEYIPQDRLQSSMWKMAQDIKTLERNLQDATSSSPQRRQNLLSTLDDMEAIMRALRPGSSSHPLLNRHGDEFLRSVQQAKLGLQQEPSNDFFAAQLSGACKNCHKDAAR